MFKLFKNKNFFFLFWGRFITNIGDSIYHVAAMWLVYDLTKSAFYTGLTGALIMLPQTFDFLIGPLIDRWNLKSILVNTQLIQCLLILIIPISFYYNVINVWLVISIMFIVVCVEQFAYPAQSAAIPKLLTKEELAAGNSLMTFAYQGTNFILTSLSGILIVYIGASKIYLIDSITFLIATLLFKSIKIKQVTNHSTTNTTFNLDIYKTELAEGFKLIYNSFIPKLIIPLIIANFIFGMINAILPDYAYLRGGGEYYGYYLASMSIGMLIGSLLATKLRLFPLGKTIIFTFFISSIFWYISYTVSQASISIICFGITLISLGIANVLIFSMLQSLIPEHILGRVFTVISSILSISLPFGSLIGGYLATQIGSNYVYLGGSLACIFIVIYWSLYPSLRKLPSYTKMEAKDYIKQIS